MKNRWMCAMVVVASLLAGWVQGESIMNETNAKPSATETATFGAGCFWCVEAVFERIPGVLDVVSGYQGGDMKKPSYEAVCRGDTGHAEVVKITFDPSVVDYDKLLDVFWMAHDPTQLNRQGADVGTQYRSVIFYHNENQRKAAEASKAAADSSGKFSRPIMTQIVPASEFYIAEAYHQDYYRNNPHAPYSQHVIREKLRKFK